MYSLRLFFVSILFSSVFSLSAQIAGYGNNYATINPATTGLFYDYDLSFNSQFSEYGNMFAVGYNMRVSAINSGVGISLKRFDEQGGDGKWQSLHLNYAYHFRLKKARILSLGTNAFLSRSILESGELYNYSSLDFGIAYSTPKLLVGLALDGLMTQKNYKHRGTYNLHASYLFNIGENWGIRPEVYLRTSFSRYNSRLIYKKDYWISAGYVRNSNSGSSGWSFMAGYDTKKKFKISYALTNYKEAGRDSDYNYYEKNVLYHELILAYVFGKK